MRYALTFVLLTLTLAGCPQPKQPGTRVTPPPSGQGHYTTDDGMRLTLFTPLGRIKYGETKAASLSEGGLTGFVLTTSQGDQPVFTLRSRSAALFSITAYGPRAETGLWGTFESTRSSKAPTRLDTWSPTAAGDHFILIRVFGATNAEIEFSATCDGCAAPACEDVETCNLYCPDGLVHDDQGCLGCACEGSTCPSTGCRGSDICVFPCGRGVCRDGQTCVDEQCEDGTALCGVDRCERGDACIDGDCRPGAFECNDPVDACSQRCPEEARPVCGAVGDRRQTFTNRCHAECAGADPIASGRCESSCDEMTPCDDGLECVRGQCRPRECDCPSNGPVAQVCGDSGLTHPSACHAGCANDPVAYRGRCRENLCESQSDCRFGEVCAPVLRNSMMRGVECDLETDEDCALECRQLPRCSLERECPRRGSNRAPSLGCYPVTANEGVCFPTCSSDAAGRCPLGRCSAVLHRRDLAVSADGLCLPGCEDDSQCPGSLRCLPDLQGVKVCQTCACNDFPDDPICVGNRRFPNRCAALCDGLGASASSRPDETEVCDEVDNDCDGNVDEGLEGVAEICDGLDNDCDGRTDEGIARRMCGQDVGECESGFQACDDGVWTECQRMNGAARERCDNLDNDCDGRVDEGFDAVDEVCDGLDNDCDGRTDEGIARRMCGQDAGECESGFQICDDGAWTECQRVNGAARERCDNLDNDCDGRVDEGFDAVDEVCDGLDNDCDGRVDENNTPCREGDDCEDVQRNRITRDCARNSDNPVCRRGHQICVEGAWGECQSPQIAVREVCDDQDNDCDGRIDEAMNANGAGPDDGGCAGPGSPCDECPIVWEPICDQDGTVYMNQCEARCSAAELREQPLQACYGLDAPLPTACRNDDQCAESGRQDQLCISLNGADVDALAQVGARLSERAQCLANTGRCGCSQRQCAFQATDATRRCLPGAEPQAMP